VEDAIVNDDWLPGEAPGAPLPAVAGRAAAVAGRAAAVRSWQGRGFLSVAAGVADVALGSGGHAWDYAAAKLIVEEAGGRFSDLRGRERIDSGDAVVTNGLLHRQVLDLLG
jgi:histidinol-phosphatase